MHHIAFGGRAPPGPLWGAYNAPTDPLAGLRGAYFLGKGMGRKGRKEEGGREAMEGEGEGGRRIGKVGVRPLL